MASAVKTQPNHYERLGLSSDASSDEVTRAFAREISSFRPHAINDIAHITLAYETLRDPTKRRAYDASIAPEPEPEPEPRQEPPEPVVRRDSWPFIASARIGSADLPALHTLPRRDAPAEPVAVPETPRSSDAKPARAAPRRINDDRPLQAIFEDRFRLVDDHPRDWKRPAAIVGGLFGGVALLGAGLGWYASRDIEPAQAKPAIAFPIPKAVAPTAAAPATDVPAVTEALPERRTRTAAAAPRGRPAPVQLQTVASEPQPADDIPDIPTEQVAALTAPDTSTPSKMPLPGGVIARTIGRIGYACGSVASTTAVDKASGIFKVTCSSGDSYRAAPVRGRYHFKRWSGD